MAIATGLHHRVYPDGFNRRIALTTADDGDVQPSNKGFMVDLDGTLSVQFRMESALAPLVVLAGIIYPGDVAKIDISASTTVTTVWLLQSVSEP